MSEKNTVNHIAFIMDGNGRWAKKRLLPRNLGHRQGIKALKKVINACIDNGVKFISLYAFSTENWKRDKSEIKGLMDLIREFMKLDFMTEFVRPVKVMTMGDLSRLDKDIQENIQDITADSEGITDAVINIGINYGSRSEIANAFNLMIRNGIREASEDSIKKFLYTKDIPDPDIVVRTSGEVRLSNFMLYQSAYSELIFLDKLWPDMNAKDIEKIIKEYQKRERKYGA